MPMATLQQCYSWLGISTTYTPDDTFIIGVIMNSVNNLFTDFLGYSVSQQSYTEFYPPRVNLTQRDMLVDAFERSGTNKVVPIDRYRNERRVLMLRNLPVRQVLSVTENPDAWLSSPPDFSSQFLLVQGNDYSIDMDSFDSLGNAFSKTGFLIRETGPWSVAERCVQVSYIGGYTDIELGTTFAQFQYAFLTQVQLSYNSVLIHRMNGSRLGSMPGVMTSESLGDWSGSYDATTAARLYGFQYKLAPAVMGILETYMNYSAFISV